MNLAYYLHNDRSRLIGAAYARITGPECSLDEYKQKWALKALEALPLYTPSLTPSGQPKRDLIDWAVGYVSPGENQLLKKEMVDDFRTLLVKSAEDLRSYKLASA